MYVSFFHYAKQKSIIVRDYVFYMDIIKTSTITKKVGSLSKYLILMNYVYTDMLLAYILYVYTHTFLSLY